jgi:sugar/nucleoside kinase (ribokinase family)
MAQPTGEPEVDVFLSGLLFADVVLTGLAEPPALGREVFATGLGTSLGGIANFAVALSRLGLRTSLAAAVGNDFYGDYVWDSLIAEGIDLARSRRFPDWPMPLTVALAYDGDRALITHQQPAPATPDDLVGVPPACRAAIVHLGPEPARWLAPTAATGTLIFADVGWDPDQQWPADLLDQLRSCHGFLPNEHEAMAYTRTDSPRAALARLAELVPLAVVTRGPAGALAVDTGTGETAEVDGLRVPAVDPTGAGDVFGAALVAATLAGWPLADRLRFACLCAALSVQGPGGASSAPGWPALRRWWQQTRSSGDDPLIREYAFLDDVLPAPSAIAPDVPARRKSD